MTDTYDISATATIDSPAPIVYATIADYHAGHPKIVPPRAFTNLQVVRGGVGAGTEITFDARAFGRTQVLRALVTEPEPGRVLVESYPESGMVTTFTVVPRDARSCEATITTRMPRRGGILGALEKLMAAPYLHRVFAEELSRLAVVARGGTP